MTIYRSKLEEQVANELIKSGWPAEGIIYEPKISLGTDRFLLPDFVLTFNLYPLAVVEVVNPAFQHRNEEQALQSAEVISVPYAILISPSETKVFKTGIGGMEFDARIPSPQDLWEGLGREWNPNDPRIFTPATLIEKTPRLHQILAISRALDVAVSGNKQFWLSMSVGSGVSYVESQIAWKLISSGFAMRLLVLNATRQEAEQQFHIFRSLIEDVHLLRPKDEVALNRRIHIGLPSFFTSQNAHQLSKLPNDFYDLIIIRDVGTVEGWFAIARYFKNVTIIGLSSVIEPTSIDFFNQPIFAYSRQEMLKEENIEQYLRPPSGFRSVRIGDIADIRFGFGLRKKQSDEIQDDTTPHVYLFGPRDILPDGGLSQESADQVPSDSLGSTDRSFDENLYLRSNDILISRFTGGNEFKLAFVPRKFSSRATFSTGLLLVRVKGELAEPKDVFDFLKSDTGKRLLQLVPSRGTIRHLSVSTLTELPIFLPETRAAKENVPTELSDIARAIQRINKEILPKLEALEHDRNSNAPEVQERETLAEKLKEVAATLSPPTLEEQVLNDYPMPIALAYRRFLDSRFNVFEQILRLRDVFEAVSYFVYNVILADALHRLDPQKYFIRDTNARNAYDGYSMAYRLGFIESVSNIAKPDNGRELFMPEIVDSSVVAIARQLQREFRNYLSHTAAATESRQLKLLGTFEPKVRAMLQDLKFLSEYRLVRITMFFYQQSQLVRRMELYRGPVPNLEEEILDSAAPPTKAEHDHIVLLDNEDRVLDLYPIYQRIANEQTRDESHLCFLKQRKMKEKELEGESIQGAFAVKLEGYDEFSTLQSRLSNRLQTEKGNKR